MKLLCAYFVAVLVTWMSFASKLVATVFSGLALKSMVGFLVESQNQGGGGFFGLVLNRQLSFGDLSLKITTMVSLFWSQNQTGYGLSVAP
jgi:hypothetical protein